MIEIAILLTCHNRKDKTIQCLDALYACDLPNDFCFDVFLVDDGSTDGTAEAISVKYPKTNIIQGTGRLFWNRGMHLAWQSALVIKEYDYFLWLNDDSYLYDFAIVELLNCSKVKKDNAIICGVLCSKESGEFSYGPRLGKQNLLPNGEMHKANTINGNVVLVPKHVYKKVGLLDPIFPHAIGDFDYGLRALKIGVSIFSTTKYIATCEPNSKLPKWCYVSTSLSHRIKALYSPLGNAHPYYFFIYEKRHFGLFLAIKHFLSIHLRVILPGLWKDK